MCNMYPQKGKYATEMRKKKECEIGRVKNKGNRKLGVAEEKDSMSVEKEKKKKKKKNVSNYTHTHTHTNQKNQRRKRK